MTDPGPDPTGSGDIKTYVSGTMARTSVDASVNFTTFAPPEIVTINPPAWNVVSAVLDVEDYFLLNGLPVAIPKTAVRLRSRCGVGEYIYTDAPPAPFDVDVSATMRWIPTDSTFTPDGTWAPTFGDGMVLTSEIGPYLDDSYSFEVRGGDEVSLPAVIISGDSGMTLSDSGWSANAFTFLMVAVMHPNPEGPRFTIFESFDDAVNDNALTDPDGSTSAPVNWGVSCAQGVLSLHAGGTIVDHQISFIQARPVLIAVALDSGVGKLFVCDRTKSTRSFSTDGFALFNIELLLGQSSAGSANESAYMDVLDFCYWDRALSFAELSEVLSTLDAVYGIVD